MAKANRKKKSPRLVEKDSLGECLHVALRKCCDSTPTTVAYNVVRLMPNSIWLEWLESVWGELSTISTPAPDDMGNALKQASMKYDPGSYYVGERDMEFRGKKPKPAGSLREFINSLPAKDTVGRTIDEILKERDYWRFVWHGVTEMFDERDWGGFAAYLYHE